MEKTIEIPKIIHYCWFGGNQLPEQAHKCIASWRKFLPDYEIKEWNEQNFDVYQAPYVAEAYRLKKYAHVSDYARFWILYHYGGIYFDTDVEVIRPLDDLIERGSFVGYNHHHLVKWNGRHTGNVTLQATQFLDYNHKEVLEDDIVKVSGLFIYPIEYFCPLNYYTGEMNITNNTRTIHHYMASWVKKQNRLQALYMRINYILVRILCAFKHYPKLS